MKKKLFLLLLIVALTAFVFTGCTPPAEGEGEGEGEIEGVVVDIDGAVELDGRTYVADGNHTITVTFPAPVANVNVYISDCTGDYNKQPYYYQGRLVALWPNEDKTVWTGSGSFVCESCDNDCYGKATDCCASYVQVVAGECAGDVCISVPVIVDCGKPYAAIKVKVDDCCCETCELIFTSTEISTNACDSCADTECCGDDCSGLASWQIDLYKLKKGTGELDEFFDACCGITPCAELVDTCTGTECPIKCETKCLDAGEIGKPAYYYAVITLEDNVGLKQTYYAQIELVYTATATATAEEGYDTGCNVKYYGLCCDKNDTVDKVKYGDTIGACNDVDDPCEGYSSVH